MGLKENDLNICYLKIVRDKMPLSEIKYQNTVIYKIQHNEKDELLYVGHTTDFIQRKYKHKFHANNEAFKQSKYKVYQMIRENGGWDSFKMLEVKKYPCNDKREAEAEEDRIMKEFKAIMNSKSSFVDKKEYMKNFNKDYYEKNKEVYSRLQKENKMNNKEYYESKIQCKCGLFLRRYSMNTQKHIQSKRHQAGIIAQQ